MMQSTIMRQATWLLRGRREDRDLIYTVMGRAQMGTPRAKRSGGAEAGPERLLIV